MTDIVLSPEQEANKKRYERAQAQHERKGFYRISYYQWLQVFSDRTLSYEAAAARLYSQQDSGLGQYAWNRRALHLRQRFFPEYDGRKRLRGKGRAAEKQAKMARVWQDKGLQQLSEYCSPLSLPIEPEEMLGGGQCPDVTVAGVPCSVTYTTSSFRPDARHTYVCVRDLMRRSLEGKEFMLLIVNTSEPVAHKELYVIPVSDLNGMASIFIPLNLKNRITTSRDWERYRGERGLRLIKEAAKKLAAKTGAE